MNDPFNSKIQQLKEEIYKEIESVHEIRQLVNREIDRDFPIDLWELSDRELDQEMGDRLSQMNDSIDTRPTADAITSHRRVVGKFIVKAKRLVMKLINPYTNTLLEKQRIFNDKLVAFHLATFIRLRRCERKLKDIEEKLTEIEENQQIHAEKLQEIQDRLSNSKNENR